MSYETIPINLKKPSTTVKSSSTIRSSTLQSSVAPPVYTNYKVYKKPELDFNYQNVSTSLVTSRDFSKSQEIILSDIQKEWADRVLDILSDNRLYIDTSDMGSGKTFIVLHLAVALKLPLFIICPASVEGVWIAETKNYRIPLAGIISYQSLRATKDKQPKHGYLQRFDDDLKVAEDSQDDSEGESTVNTYFEATNHFLKLVEKGILLVFDEFQMIKNDSAQFKASHGLIKGLDSVESNSRIGLLSATPIDKPKQSVNLFYIMNFISNTDILENHDELFEKCQEISPDITQEIINSHNLNDPDELYKAIFSLYERIIKDQISGYIEPLGLQYTFKGDEIIQKMKNADYSLAKKLAQDLKKEIILNDIKNGYYNLSSKAKGLLYEAVETLNRTAAFVIEKKGKIVGSRMGALVLALVEVEKAKIEIFCRIGLETLMANPKNKIIFCVNYKNTVLALREFFKSYDPLVLIGSIEKKNRPAIIATFNKNLKRRVLICNTEVGGVGISLHDTVGDSPRFMFISPSYRMLSIHQATGRIYRRGVRSNATTRLVFGNLDGLQEEKLIAALHRKSAILRRAIRNKNILLPDQYPTEIETQKVTTVPGVSASVDDTEEPEETESPESGSEGEDEYLDDIDAESAADGEADVDTEDVEGDAGSDGDGEPEGDGDAESEAGSVN